jgi:hypothetical protein
MFGGLLCASCAPIVCAAKAAAPAKLANTPTCGVGELGCDEGQQLNDIGVTLEVLETRQTT